ncbi:MAG: type IV secretion protein IcmX [Legionellaceae bacterium]|nr:type IV secretion protein IcmX [Legionellaceae bacterium]
MRFFRYVLPCTVLALALTSPVYAADRVEDPEDYDSIKDLIKHFGAYFGFDLTKPPEKEPELTLLDPAAATLTQQYSFITFLGARPVNANSTASAAFVPQNTKSYSVINDMANYSFQTQPSGGSYNNPQVGSQGGISVSKLIDQASYQRDPITQSVLNILGTPNHTYCMNNDESAWLDDCRYLYDTQVMSNVVGSIPNSRDFFSYAYNEPVIPQLNANTLISPLMYTMEDNASSTSSAPNNKSDENGLVAKTQAQEAENFIRYAAQLVTPPELPKKKAYDELYIKTLASKGSSISERDKKLAEQGLAKYIAKLRTFSAQSSVPTSNLYALLSKRIPQGQGGDDSAKISQALSEFQMATRRLYDPANKDKKQWVDQINEASSATVEKEIAILLAEMNYQLYLSRQQEERTLLTLSMMLMQNLKAPDFKETATIDLND